MLELALKRGCMEFLRRVWGGNHNLQEGVPAKKREKKSIIWEFLNRQASNYEEKTQLRNLLDASFIMDHLLLVKKIEEAR